MSSVKEAQQFRTLAETEVKRSALMRAVSTDLGGSLSQIQQKVTALLDGGATAPVRVQRERLLAIESEVQRLTRVVNNLTDLGRLESESVTPHKLSVTVRPLDRRGARRSRDRVGDSIEVDVPDDLPRIDTDPEMAERVLSIVIANACASARAGTRFASRRARPTTRSRFLVVDTGPGIKPSAARDDLRTGRPQWRPWRARHAPRAQCGVEIHGAARRRGPLGRHARRGT